jgi:hypothetical protein
MTQDLRVQELDFDTIKDNLKEFMRGKPEFSDYDFEGSGISALLNVLAYNTHYMAVLANMQMNELFLDTATKRTTAALHASRMGYVPRSIKSPIAKVNLEIFTGNDSPATLTIGKGAVFTTSLSGDTYQFITTDAYTIPRSNDGRYVFENLSIREGSLKTFRFQYLASNPIRFIIPSRNADISTLKVRVQVSSSNTSTAIYNLNTSIVDNSKDSQVYYLRLNQAGYYEVLFGDDIISKAIQDGNIVILEYVETNGISANGVSSFTFSDNVQGYSSNIVTTVMAAIGGDKEESADEIKISARSSLLTQNRAVVESDYETMVQEIYPADSISVWGGERNDPPIYGKVFVSVKPTGGGTLTESTKEFLANNLQRKNILTVSPVFVDPSYTFIGIESKVYFDSTLTDNSPNTIKTLAIMKIVEFANSNLGKFGNTFRYSKLTQAIDSADTSILSNITNVNLYKYVSLSYLKSLAQTIEFGNAITPGSISSDAFYCSGIQYPLYFDDVDGVIRVYYKDVGAKKIFLNNAGSVDYTTGKITISNILSLTSLDSIKIWTSPKENDILTTRNNILMLIDSDINVSTIADTKNSASKLFA